MLITSFRYSGNPTPLQQALRITEICYHPRPPEDDELEALPEVSGSDFEYLELVNLSDKTIALSDAQFTLGIRFSFPDIELAAGARVVLAKNPAAFELRYGTLPVPVLGPYDGELDGSGEKIELTDPFGEIVLVFRFKDGWYPATDGQGRSLVLRDPANTPPEAYGDPKSWAISLEKDGTPGHPDSEFAQAYYGWDNFHFSAPERDDPRISGPEADPDGDGRPNLAEYAFGTNPRAADAEAIQFTWVEGRTAVRFLRPSHALDLAYELLASDDLVSWSAVPALEYEVTPAGENLEAVTLGELSPTAEAARFLKVRAIWR
jgi:hypothetical protein